MRERVAFIVDAPDGALVPLDRDHLSRLIADATGLATTCVGGGSDFELPFEPVPDGTPLQDMPASDLFTGVSVLAAHCDVAVFGEMPVVRFDFHGPGGVRRCALIGDERFLQSCATLVRNAVAQAVSATSKIRRTAGAGPIPRTWNP